MTPSGANGITTNNGENWKRVYQKHAVNCGERPQTATNENSKLPPVKTGGIAGFRLRLPDFVGYFHPPVLLVVLKSEE
jgi:hypothetical protein